MKKNKIKYVLIPAFAAATLFPVLANDNQAKASEDKTTAPANVTNTANTNDKAVAVNNTDKNATNNAVVTPSTSPVTSANTVARLQVTMSQQTVLVLKTRKLLNQQFHLLLLNINKKVL